MDGWEPRTVTEYEYADGVLVRSVEYREPEFDDAQVDLMIAYQRYVADVGRHGHLMSEATDPKADPNEYDGGYRYVADDPVVDWAEKARLDAEEAWRRAAGDDVNMNGLIFPVRKVTDQSSEQ